MAAPSLREVYIAALTARGSKIVETKSTKFIKMTYGADSANGIFYFIGRSGSLRKGATIAGSVPLSDAYKQMLRESVR